MTRKTIFGACKNRLNLSMFDTFDQAQIFPTYATTLAITPAGADMKS